jgi:subtilase family serine protease
MAQSSPQHDRIAAHPDFTATTSVHNTLPRWSTADRDLGSLPDATPMSVQLVLARSPELQTAFDQLLEDQQNPNSPRFHQWLTPEQLGQQYGPTQHDLDALTGWLSAQGLTVSSISPSRVLVRATGTAASIGSAFKTSFHQFTFAGVPQYSATSEPVVPAALAPILSTIAGLSQVTLHPTSHIQALPAPRATPGAKPDYSSTNGTHYLFAGDFATIYDINPLYTANIKGSGQKVAIIGESQVVTSDITEYESLSAISTNTPNTIVVPAGSGGSNPGIVMGDEGESDLDLDRVIGVAPSVTADFVISGSSPTLGQGIGIAIDYEINNLKDPVMTLSYGACEAAAGSANTLGFASSMSSAAAEGISVFISSDDSAAAGCDAAFTAAPAVQQLSINYLCASQYVTCVGGTEFNDTASPSSYWAATNSTGEVSALGYIPEGGWNESLTSSNTPTVAGSGGGVSVYVTKPSFQTGIGVPADGYRDVPDVSFTAASHDGYFGCEADATFSGGATGDCSKGQGVVSSGTSAAAPGWAGVAALLNEKLGSAQGNLNPLIYRLGSLTTSNPFHDVTPATAGVSPCVLTTPSLCNNSTPSPTAATGGLAGYAVTPGYDLVTGWGSIDVFNFVTAASTQASLTATSTTLTASPTTIKTTQTVVFTATVSATSGTPTGAIQFNSNGTALGAPVTLVNGVATSPAESFPTIGSYTITAVYSGSSTFADSASQALTLAVTAPGTNPSTSTLTATATATSLTTSQTVSFTDTVTGTGGTPGGTVQFLVDGVSSGSPVTLNSAGVATLGPLALGAGTHSVSAVYSGNTSFVASTSNTVQVVVTALASSTSITAGATTINPNGFLVLSGTVTGVSGGAVPTGSLTLYQAGSPVSNPIALTGGLVDVYFTGIPAGTYSFYWVYSGDAIYASSQSSAVTITVSASFSATYTLTPESTSVTVTDGTSATNTVTVASSNGYSTSIALSCTAVYTGSSTDTIVEPSCSLSPATINLLNDSATNINTTSLYETSTLTLGSTVPHNIKRAANSTFQLAPMLGGTALAGLFLFLLPATRRRRSWNALAAILLLTAIAGIGGCGSGGTPTNSTPPLSGSPAGTYTVTVTGTGAVTTTFTLTLQ